VALKTDDAEHTYPPELSLSKRFANSCRATGEATGFTGKKRTIVRVRTRKSASDTEVHSDTLSVRCDL